ARNTFVESIRQPFFFIVVLLSGILQVLNTWGANFSMGYSSSGEVSGDNKLLLDIGLAPIFGCGMILAGFIATSVVSREIENKTVLTVVSKPIGRTPLILGKYLGVVGAILLAIVPMLIFLLLAIRHEVMSTAADDLDQPVLVFGILAVVLAMGIGAWCNFFYGWAFGQTVVSAVAPLSVVAYVLVLLINKEWHAQPPGTDFKPQVLLACASMSLALLVLCAVAIAASTRLGQVMTMFVCAGVFFLGLLTNFMVGRHVFLNDPVGMIIRVEAPRGSDEDFIDPGDTLQVTLDRVPDEPIPAGSTLYWGPNPNGLGLSVPGWFRFEGDIGDSTTIVNEAAPPTVVITEVEGERLTIRLVGRAGTLIAGQPQLDDFAFITPTRRNWVAFTIWSVFPNMHHFWLVDAITQNQAVPISHIVRIVGYAAIQIVLFLSLAVVLFQKRDVG
ncbi:MAG: ABC transporter permease subunit, partial [Phycisphaerales bacterium]|nr:ABC transporter permease subunit [Phycisphaerales bacterium]